jgi:pSer/pThr/pTyr-binding forkhead associated (FHA) protein
VNASLLSNQDQQLYVLIDQLSQLTSHTIGRSLNNTIVVSDSRVSGQHARLTECTPSTFLLEDLNSKNGTFVDGVRITRKFVDRANAIQLADTILSIEELLAQLRDPTPASVVPLPTPAPVVYQKPEPAGTTQQASLDFSADFAALESVYRQYPQLKRACRQREKMIRTGSVILSSVVGISAVVASGGTALSLLQVMSSAGLSVLVPTLCSTFLSTDEKLELIDKEYRDRYRCPNAACRDPFGTREWDMLAQQKTCRRCQAVWVR